MTGIFFARGLSSSGTRRCVRNGKISFMPTRRGRPRLLALRSECEGGNRKLVGPSLHADLGFSRGFEIPVGDESACRTASRRERSSRDAAIDERESTNFPHATRVNGDEGIGCAFAQM